MAKTSKAIKTIELIEYSRFDEYEFNKPKDFDEHKEADKYIKVVLKRCNGDKQKIIKYLNKISSLCREKEAENIKRDNKGFQFEIDAEAMAKYDFKFNAEDIKKKKEQAEWERHSQRSYEKTIIKNEYIYFNLLESIKQ